MTDRSGEGYSIEDVLAVANSRHGPGAHRGRAQAGWTEPHDHLDSPQRAVDFLSGRMPLPDRPPDALALASLRRVRDLVWGVWERADEADWDQVLEELLSGARYRLDSEGGLHPDQPGWPGVVAGLLPPLLELKRQSHRLKRCENPRCGWLYLDRSRNRSRRWCEMATCGNRAKAYRYKQRNS